MEAVMLRLTGEKSADLVCAECGNSRQITVSNLPQLGKIYRIRCQCGNTAALVLDRRKHKRQRINFIGLYSVKGSIRDHIVSVVNLSRKGLCFKRTDNTRLGNGQVISIDFQLDNPERDSVQCEAIVRSVIDDKVGVEFQNLGGRIDRTLGFYLMGHDGNGKELLIFGSRTDNNQSSEQLQVQG